MDDGQNLSVSSTPHLSSDLTADQEEYSAFVRSGKPIETLLGYLNNIELKYMPGLSRLHTGKIVINDGGSTWIRQMCYIVTMLSQEPTKFLQRLGSLFDDDAELQIIADAACKGINNAKMRMKISNVVDRLTGNANTGTTKATPPGNQSSANINDYHSKQLDDERYILTQLSDNLSSKDVPYTVFDSKTCRVELCEQSAAWLRDKIEKLLRANLPVNTFMQRLTNMFTSTMRLIFTSDFCSYLKHTLLPAYTGIKDGLLFCMETFGSNEPPKLVEPMTPSQSVRSDAGSAGVASQKTNLSGLNSSLNVTLHKTYSSYNAVGDEAAARDYSLKFGSTPIKNFGSLPAVTGLVVDTTSLEYRQMCQKAICALAQAPNVANVAGNTDYRTRSIVSTKTEIQQPDFYCEPREKSKIEKRFQSDMFQSRDVAEHSLQRQKSRSPEEDNKHRISYRRRQRSRSRSSSHGRNGKRRRRSRSGSRSGNHRSRSKKRSPDDLLSKKSSDVKSYDVKKSTEVRKSMTAAERRSQSVIRSIQQDSYDNLSMDLDSVEDEKQQQCLEPQPVPPPSYSLKTQQVLSSQPAYFSANSQQLGRLTDLLQQVKALTGAVQADVIPKNTNFIGSSSASEKTADDKRQDYNAQIQNTNQTNDHGPSNISKATDNHTVTYDFTRIAGKTLDDFGSPVSMTGWSGDTTNDKTAATKSEPPTRRRQAILPEPSKLNLDASDSSSVPERSQKRKALLPDCNFSKTTIAPVKSTLPESRIPDQRNSKSVPDSRRFKDGAKTPLYSRPSLLQDLPQQQKPSASRGREGDSMTTTPKALVAPKRPSLLKIDEDLNSAYVRSEYRKPHPAASSDSVEEPPSYSYNHDTPNRPCLLGSTPQRLHLRPTPLSSATLSISDWARRNANNDSSTAQRQQPSRDRLSKSNNGGKSGRQWR